MSEINRALCRFWKRIKADRGTNPLAVEDAAFVSGWRAATQIKLSLTRKAMRLRK